jgi:hypothetical protein
MGNGPGVLQQASNYLQLMLQPEPRGSSVPTLVQLIESGRPSLLTDGSFCKARIFDMDVLLSRIENVSGQEFLAWSRNPRPFAFPHEKFLQKRANIYIDSLPVGLFI